MKETIDKIAKLFIKSLTLDELEYCTRKPSIGFSALHDRFCANEALMAVIDKFVRNDLVPDDCPDNLGELIDDFDFLNKCGERITELLKALCGDGFRICTQEIFKE